MLQYLTMCSVVVVAVLTALYMGAAPTLAQEQWKTFYSPQYKFSFDYPVNQTKITDKNSTNTEFYKLIETSTINFYVKVSKTTMDPQEFLVAYSQSLPKDNYITIEGGVKPIMVDFVSGYMYNALNQVNGAMITAVDFEHNGYTYLFLIEGPPHSFDRTQTHKLVESIKFFN